MNTWRRSLAVFTCEGIYGNKFGSKDGRHHVPKQLGSISQSTWTWRSTPSVSPSSLLRPCVSSKIPVNFQIGSLNYLPSPGLSSPPGNLKKFGPSCRRSTWGRPCSWTTSTPSTDRRVPDWLNSFFKRANLSSIEWSRSYRGSLVLFKAMDCILW